MSCARRVLPRSKIPCLANGMTAVATPRAAHRLNGTCGTQGTGAPFLSSPLETPSFCREQSLLPFLLGLREAPL